MTAAKDNVLRSTVWLLESENNMYVGIGPFGSFGWVSDPHSAIRMSRRKDAEALMSACNGTIIGFHERAKGPTEHVFYDELERLNK